MKIMAKFVIHVENIFIWVNNVYCNIKIIVKINKLEEKNQRKDIQPNMSKIVSLLIQIQIIFIDFLRLICKNYYVFNYIKKIIYH